MIILKVDSSEPWSPKSPVYLLLEINAYIRKLFTKDSFWCCPPICTQPL